jgi:acetyl/propionyl-CoA carboxylase alpha subunit
MRRALVDLTILGVETSRDFHVRVMDDPEFQRGEIEIQWLERRLPSLLERRPSPESERIAAIAGALLAERDRTARNTSGASTSVMLTSDSREAPDSWKQFARVDGLRY